MANQVKEFRQPREDEGESFPKFVKPVVDGEAKEGGVDFIEVYHSN